MMARIVGWTMLLLAILGACSPGKQKKPLVILAAASLQNPLDSLLSEFERENDTDVRVAYGASGMLAQQIRSGARADLFLTADTTWIERLLDGDVDRIAAWTPWLTNRLVVAVHKNATYRVDSLADLKAEAIARIVIADPQSAPVGRYAEAALRQCGLSGQVQDRMIIAENAAAATRTLRVGLADAAIVYETDLRPFTDLRIGCIVPDTLYPPVVYGLVVLDRMPANDASRAELLGFLISERARSVFAQAGFQPLPQQMRLSAGGQ